MNKDTDISQKLFITLNLINEGRDARLSNLTCNRMLPVSKSYHWLAVYSYDLIAYS